MRVCLQDIALAHGGISRTAATPLAALAKLSLRLRLANRYALHQLTIASQSLMPQSGMRYAKQNHGLHEQSMHIVKTMWHRPLWTCRQTSYNALLTCSRFSTCASRQHICMRFNRSISVKNAPEKLRRAIRRAMLSEVKMPSFTIDIGHFDELKPSLF